MHRFSCILFAMLLLAPRPSSAIQLHWSSGRTDLSTTSAVRCTLVVQADPSEGRLPSEWRLLWAADSCDVQPIPLPPHATCGEDVAEISDVSGPSDAAEVAANVTNVRFCSAGDTPASTAFFVLDLACGSRARFKVAALDASDPSSGRVVQSEEVTLNGGVEKPFPSVILGSSTVHHSTEFLLKAVGAGLSQATNVALVAADGSWRQPLTVTDRTNESISATAQLAANVPACVVEATGENDAVTAAVVPADPPPPVLPLFDLPEGCETRMREVWPDHDPYLIQPKDFAFVPGGWTSAGSWLFHIFYIRHNQYLANDFTEKNIGHAVSDTLSGWTVIDTAAISVRDQRFDGQHVWAPHIVRRGLTFTTFYTGVDGVGNQRIGLATSTDLVHWTQADSVLEVTDADPNQIPWADPSPDSLYGGAAQLRDAFVTEDPDVHGDWLMYFVTVAREFSPEMVVGVARSHGDFSSWGETFPLWSTHHAWPNPLNNPPTAYVVESPHVFYRNGKWRLFSTVNGDSVWSTANSSSPSDTTTANWSEAQKLWTLVPALQAPNLYFWHATEYLQISELNDVEYLAAFNDANVCISITQMRPASSPSLFSMGCPSVAAVGYVAAGGVPRLQLTGMRPARSQVGLRIDLPTRTSVSLAIYDVLGRRIRTIASGELPAGGTEMLWDGRDGNGARVGSGVYFVSLTAAGTRRSVRVPLIR
jgi:predicted GH43/DUF377 family glycosyl hydrolase